MKWDYRRSEQNMAQGKMQQSKCCHCSPNKWTSAAIIVLQTSELLRLHLPCNFTSDTNPENTSWICRLNMQPSFGFWYTPNIPSQIIKNNILPLLSQLLKLKQQSTQSSLTDGERKTSSGSFQLRFEWSRSELLLPHSISSPFQYVYGAFEWTQRYGVGWRLQLLQVGRAVTINDVRHLCVDPMG